jgi:hypothetical protein
MTYLGFYWITVYIRGGVEKVYIIFCLNLDLQKLTQTVQTDSVKSQFKSAHFKLLYAEFAYYFRRSTKAAPVC